MSRIAIGCIYDCEGIIDDYKLFLLKSVKEIVDRLIIVSNGPIMNDYKIIIDEFCDEVFFREDVGADAGAFQAYFTNRFNDVSWKQYDEVITFNDSCYGPFEKFEKMFIRMEREECDYWSMLEVKKKDFSHITPYFNVYRKRLLKTVFEDFWNQLDVNMDRCLQLEYNYEIGMHNFFKDRGYTHKTWMNLITGLEFNYGDIYDIDKMVVNGDFCNPLLKYKMFSYAINPSYEELIAFIDENYEYDAKLIKTHLKRIEEKNRLYPFSRKVLRDFIKIHDKNYIYGHGDYGRSIELYCRKNGLKIDGFVVSKKSSDDEIEIDCLSLRKNDGIIVGVGMTLRDEIESKLLALYDKSQILQTAKY